MNLNQSTVNFVGIVNEQFNSIKTHRIKAVKILHPSRIASPTASSLPAGNWLCCDMDTSFSSLLRCCVIQRASGPDTANSAALCHKIKHDSFWTSFIEHMNKHRHVQHDLPLRLQEVQHPFIQAWPRVRQYCTIRFLPQRKKRPAVANFTSV